jgi:hypothetical protein
MGERGKLSRHGRHAPSANSSTVPFQGFYLSLHLYLRHATQYTQTTPLNDMTIEASLNKPTDRVRIRMRAT